MADPSPAAPEFIVVEGPIGVGRTSLVNRLMTDFMFDKDRLFAGLNLQRDELALYDEVFARPAMDAPKPEEKHLSTEYRARLSDAYARFFYFYEHAPVLIVNAGGLNPVDNDADYQTLLQGIGETQHGRRYFNPSPLAIK